MSHAFVQFGGSGALPLGAWEAFCRDEGFEHDPQVPGGNVWRRGGRMGVQATFGSAPPRAEGPPAAAEDILLEMLWGGSKVEELAEVARAFWVRHGGAMFADEATRKAICGDGRLD